MKSQGHSAGVDTFHIVEFNMARATRDVSSHL
jgi:hypothetical protein